MGLDILGLTISGLVAFVLLALGFIAVFGKKSLGNQVRGILGMIPIGNPKLWGAILLILGFMAGGLTYGWGLISGLTGSTSMTASLMGSDQNVVAPVSLTCEIASIGTTAGAATQANITFTQDSTDNNHYTLYIKNVTDATTASINGTISCTRSGDIEKSASVDCYVKGDSFRNAVSTTDSNVYYILETSASASKVSGMPWQQTAYVKDGAIATTSSDKEKTTVVFTGGASAQAQETIGFLFKLPGATVFNYLRADQDPQNVDIVCGDETMTVTIVKQAAVI